jgi:hypothetical protein
MASLAVSPGRLSVLVGMGSEGRSVVFFVAY